MPKYFAKSGFVDVDPKKTKKEGGGKANWGRDGDEAYDDENLHMTKPRRRSNSFVDHANNFKTKFETVDTEPVFEEEIHGATEEDLAAAGLSKTSTNELEEIPEGHDGFGFMPRAHHTRSDDASVGSSGYSVSGEDDALGGKKN